MDENADYVVDYPEHEKQAAVLDEAHAVGDFLDWIEQQEDLALGQWQRRIEDTCRWHERVDVPDDLNGTPRYRRLAAMEHICRGGTLFLNTSYLNDETSDIRAIGPCEKCAGTGWRMYDLTEPRLMPAHVRIQDLLARYFGIDLNAIEAEKRAMLESLRG